MPKEEEIIRRKHIVPDNPLDEMTDREFARRAKRFLDEADDIVITRQ